MAGFIRSLSELDGFLVELEDLKLKEESSDMKPFVQTPPGKEGKYVQPLSTSAVHMDSFHTFRLTEWNSEKFPLLLIDYYASFSQNDGVSEIVLTALHIP